MVLFVSLVTRTFSKMSILKRLYPKTQQKKQQEKQIKCKTNIFFTKSILLFDRKVQNNDQKTYMDLFVIKKYYNN